MGRGFAGGLLCQAPSEGRPRASPEGPCGAGIGQRRECRGRAYGMLGRTHPAAGSHLPAEDTAPPSVVAPFPSSPFAHPIPQSRRRARVGFVQRFLNIHVSDSRVPCFIISLSGARGSA
jgi:hypothetical protein